VDIVFIRQCLVFRIPTKSKATKTGKQSRKKKAVQRVPVVATTGIVAKPRTFVRKNASTTISNIETATHVAVTTTPWRYDAIINPRKLNPFQWLSGIARNFDLYHIDSLTIHYEPSCPTTTPGQLVMMLDYDPTDDNSLLTFEQLQASANSVVTQMYAPAAMRFDGNLTVLPQHRYFCSDELAPDRLADVCRLWVMTTAGAAVAQAGRIYLDYTVSFSNPEPSSVGLPMAGRYTTAGNAARDNNNPLGDVITSLNVTATNAMAAAAAANQVINTAQNIAGAFGVVTKGTVRSKVDLRGGADAHDLYDVVSEYELNPTPTSSGTMPEDFDGNLVFYWLGGPYQEAFLTVTTYGKWVATHQGDKPVPSIQLSPSWGIRNYYFVSSAIGATGGEDIWQIWLVHITRNPVINNGVLTFQVLMGGDGVYSRADGVYRESEVMLSPYPYIDALVPRYV
jgi:hypothetical protein